MEMLQYIGTKIINAKPMNRLDYNEFRGWKLPEDEDGTDEGYLVEYVDGGKANTEFYNGYVSWSPKEQFENAYKASGNLSFGDAIIYLKLGKKVARKGWNGKGMWLCIAYPNHTDGCDSSSIEFNKSFVDVGSSLDNFIVMKTAVNSLIPWLASQADTLAEDWEITS